MVHGQHDHFTWHIFVMSLFFLFFFLCPPEPSMGLSGVGSFQVWPDGSPTHFPIP